MGRSSTIELAKARVKASRVVTAIGYCRRSTDRQEQSIPDQQKAIEIYAKEHNLRLLRFYVDDAISGTSTVGRRAFQQLIDDAKRPTCEFGVVLVYDVKRFGRIDNDEAGHYRYILKTHGVEVLYCSENFTGDRTDDLLRPVKQWQAREESKDLSKVTIRGLLSKAGVSRSQPKHDGEDDAAGTPNRNSGGWWMGGAPPYGFDLAYQSSSGEFLFYLRYLRDGTKEMFGKNWKRTRTLARRESIAVSRKDRCKLVPGDPERVKVVRRIFKLYVEGRGFKSIVDLLNRESVPSPRGPEWSETYGGYWTISSVRGILVNPVYGGDMVWNRRTDARFHRIKNGEAVVRKDVYCRRMEWNDEKDWIVIPNAHEGLVTRRIWKQARQLLQEKPDSIRQRGVNQRSGQVVDPTNVSLNGVQWTGPRAKFLLSGLITCPRCGSRYEGRIDYGARPKDERRQRIRRYVYGCGGYIRHGRSHCSFGAVRQDQIEESVICRVVEFYGKWVNERGRQQMLVAINAELGANHREINTSRVSIDRKLAKIDRATRNLLDNITAVNRNMVDQRLEELRVERLGIERESAAVESVEATSVEVDGIVSEVIQFVSDLEASLRTGPTDQRQAAIRRCVSSIELHADTQRAMIAVRRVPVKLGNSSSAVEPLDVNWQVGPSGR